MKTRIFLAHFFIRLSKFIHSLTVVVMTPKDLAEFSKGAYSSPKNVGSWGEDKLVDKGLNPAELALLGKIPLKHGELLVLGTGGGREAIYFAQRGFKVTALDFIPAMVEKTKANALKRGLEIKGLVQDISNLNIAKGCYDIIWLSAAMYSCVPAKARRIEMLRRVKEALKPGGYFACQFHFDARKMRYAEIDELLRKALAFTILGNLQYEKGDFVWVDREFIHIFSSEKDLLDEFKEGGFEVRYISRDSNMSRGEALLLKA